MPGLHYLSHSFSMGESLTEGRDQWLDYTEQLGVDLSRYIGAPGNTGTLASIRAALRDALPPEAVIDVKLDELTQVITIQVAAAEVPNLDHRLMVAIDKVVPASITTEVKDGRIRIGREITRPQYPTRFEREPVI